MFALQYVSGLSELDYRRDQYVQRKLRDLVTYYIPRFLTVSLLGLNIYPGDYSLRSAIIVSVIC